MCNSGGLRYTQASLRSAALKSDTQHFPSRAKLKSLLNFLSEPGPWSASSCRCCTLRWKCMFLINYIKANVLKGQGTWLWVSVKWKHQCSPQEVKMYICLKFKTQNFSKSVPLWHFKAMLSFINLQGLFICQLMVSYSPSSSAKPMFNFWNSGCVTKVSIPLWPPTSSS